MDEVDIGSKYIGVLSFSVILLLVLVGIGGGILFFKSCSSIKGDSNGDSVIDSYDVKSIKDFLEGNKLECTSNADFNSDGIIDNLDSRALTTYLLSRGSGVDRGQSTRSRGGAGSPPRPA